MAGRSTATARPALLPPQQATVPSVCTPHVCQRPTLT